MVLLTLGNMVLISNYLFGILVLILGAYFIFRMKYNIEINVLGMRASGGIVLQRLRGKVVKQEGDTFMKLWGMKYKKESIPVEEYSQLIQTATRKKGAIFVLKTGEGQYNVLDITSSFSNIDLSLGDIDFKNNHVEAHRRLYHRHILNSFWKQYQMPILIGVFMFLFLMIEWLLFKDVNQNLSSYTGQVGALTQKMEQFVGGLGGAS